MEPVEPAAELVALSHADISTGELTKKMLNAATNATTTTLTCLSIIYDNDKTVLSNLVQSG